VFHYEFEFIHPFADGNGRMGRLWQSVILANWNPIFANLPVESLIYQHQQAYYQAIALSTAQTDCAAFVEFMLETIANTFTQLINESGLGKRLGKELSDNQQAILHLVTLDNKITIKELAAQLRISTTAVENNIKKLRELALLERKGGRKDGFWQIRS